jgi:Tannase and feruloyl esterase
VTCLTAAQVEAARKIYSPVINSPGGQISPGDSPGAEAVPSNWGAWITGPKAGAPAFGSLITNAFFSGIVFENPKWDFQTLNFSSDVKHTDDKLAAIFNSTNPNLRPFKAHGGKLIQYHGWGAPHISRIFCAMHHKLTFLPISCLR